MLEYRSDSLNVGRMWDTVDEEGGLAAGAPPPTQEQLDDAGLSATETAPAVVANGGAGATEKDDTET